MNRQRPPKLEQIENKLYRLWTNREERTKFLQGEIGAAREAANPDDFIPQIDPQGVKLYSSLIEIGRMDLMSSIFPVIEKLLGKQFKTLVCEYFENMPPVHFNLNQSASRFPQFLAGQDKLCQRYPFLLELADYEWIELVVLEHPAADRAFQPPAKPDQVDAAQFAALCPVLNSVFISRRYRFAIAALAEAIIEGNKLPRRVKESPACLVVYRDPDSLDARFLEMDDVSLSMLESIEQRPEISYGELITEICSQPRFRSESALSDCLEAIEQLRELKLIVAERPSNSAKTASSKSASVTAASAKAATVKGAGKNSGRAK